jgi:hypothetical protein
MAQRLNQRRQWTISANRDEARAQLVRGLSRLFRAGCRVDHVRSPEAELRVLAKFVCYVLTRWNLRQLLGLTGVLLTHLSEVRATLRQFYKEICRQPFLLRAAYRRHM